MDAQGGKDFGKAFLKGNDDIKTLLDDFLITSKDKKRESQMEGKIDLEHSLVECGNKIWKSINDNIKPMEYVDNQMQLAFQGSQIITQEAAQLLYCNIIGLGQTT